MRKFGSLLAVGAVAVAALALPAAASAAAAVPTLALKAPAGPPVPVGDTLNSSLTPGSLLTVSTAPSGGTGLICKQSSWAAKTVANPAVPGPAALQIVGMSISSCADNNPGVISVAGVTIANLPSIMQVYGSAGFPIQIIPAGPPPLEIVASLNTTSGPVSCTYQSVPPMNGSTGLGSVPWSFSGQQFQMVAGALPACGAPVDFYKAQFNPVVDLTAGGATVYVN